MLENLLESWGYVAVLIGTILEGETILVLAGFVAHQGYLDLTAVILCAFFGSTIGDQFWFFVGWRKGPSLLNSRPVWRDRAQRVNAWLEKHQTLTMMGFRFVYGMRTVTPLVIGAVGFSPRRFLVLNILGAAIWSVIVAWVGYLFGHVAEALIADLHKYEWWLAIIIAVVGVSAWLAHILWNRRRL